MSIPSALAGELALLTERRQSVASMLTQRLEAEKRAGNTNASPASRAMHGELKQLSSRIKRLESELKRGDTRCTRTSGSPFCRFPQSVATITEPPPEPPLPPNAALAQSPLKRGDWQQKCPGGSGMGNTELLAGASRQHSLALAPPKPQPAHHNSHQHWPNQNPWLPWQLRSNAKHPTNPLIRPFPAKRAPKFPKAITPVSGNRSPAGVWGQALRLC
jgi:hypothetical protein